MILLAALANGAEGPEFKSLATRSCTGTSCLLISHTILFKHAVS